MEYDPPDSPYRRAADRMTAVHDLITKQRFREALDILNTAIVIAPTYPLSYAMRAIVFESLGLHEQAQADRERERQIAATDGYPVADVVDGIATITMRRVGRRGSGIARREPAPTTGERVGRVLSPAIFGILMLVGVIAAGAGGVMLALDSIDNGNGNAVLRPTEVPTPAAAAATETPASTEEPAPEPPADVTGSPYSLSSLTSAWEDAGLSVTVEGPTDGASGFMNAATDVSTGSGEFAVFVYEDATSATEDWIFSGTASPEPRDGRTLRPNESIWFNANMIVVVWSYLGGPEFDAFVDMTP